MKLILGIFIGLFILSRLQQQGGLLFSGSVSTTPLGGHPGEIPYGGAPGIILPGFEPYFGYGGVGGGAPPVPSSPSSPSTSTSSSTSSSLLSKQLFSNIKRSPSGGIFF